jgi:hypothetical protein
VARGQVAATLTTPHKVKETWKNNNLKNLFLTLATFLLSETQQKSKQIFCKRNSRQTKKASKLLCEMLLFPGSLFVASVKRKKKRLEFDSWQCIEFYGRNDLENKRERRI